MRMLSVFNHGMFAGLLLEENPGTGYSFQYDKEYLRQSESKAISITLPLREEAYCSDSLFPFFVNMLPEGTNRKLVCRNHKIDEDDDFGLLTFFCGKDFIGSISFQLAWK